VVACYGIDGRRVGHEPGALTLRYGGARNAAPAHAPVAVTASA